MGLALAAIIKGYKLFVQQTVSRVKKRWIFEGSGAIVYVCPTAVAPDHPDSYYSVAEKLNNEIENSFWCNQYDNLSNGKAHYLSTGPELWEQTEGKSPILL